MKRLGWIHLPLLLILIGAAMIAATILPFYLATRKSTPPKTDPEDVNQCDYDTLAKPGVDDGPFCIGVRQEEALLYLKQQTKSQEEMVCTPISAHTDLCMGAIRPIIRGDKSGTVSVPAPKPQTDNKWTATSSGLGTCYEDGNGDPIGCIVTSPLAPARRAHLRTPKQGEER